MSLFREWCLLGLNEDGSVKGIGVKTRPLAEVGKGPAFGVSVQGVEDFEEIKSPKDGDMVFDSSDLYSIFDLETNGFTFEGHYLQPQFRRFIRTDHRGVKVFSMTHFWKDALLTMPVIESPSNSEYPGFLAIEAFRASLNYGESGFSLGGPGENERLSPNGNRIADLICCQYPRHSDKKHRRNVNYPNRETEQSDAPKSPIGRDSES